MSLVKLTGVHKHFGTNTCSRASTSRSSRATSSR